MEVRSYEDSGFLGPSSVAWRVISHPAAAVGGMRALLIQTLHPLAMAGVAEFSNYQANPLKRLQRTSYYVAATTFGDKQTALHAADRVKKIHKKVKGIDPITKKRYSAEDPQTQLWVHCTEWHSFLSAYEAYAGKLTLRERDQYIAEGQVIAELLDLNPEITPGSIKELNSYFREVRHELLQTKISDQTIRFVLRPPLSREILLLWPTWSLLGRAGLALVPRDLRNLMPADQLKLLDLAAGLSTKSMLSALRLPGLNKTLQMAYGKDTLQLSSRGRG
jgi:uncharacterized protein (DUF2236 family)